MERFVYFLNLCSKAVYGTLDGFGAVGNCFIDEELLGSANSFLPSKCWGILGCSSALEEAKSCFLGGSNQAHCKAACGVIIYPLPEIST